MKLDRQNKLILLTSSIIIAVGAIVFAILWATIGTMSLFLGWLLGSLIGVAGFFLIVIQTNNLNPNVGKPLIWGMGAFFIRFILYGAGLLLAALLTKYVEPEIFNIFAVFGGYIPPRLSIYIVTFISGKTKLSFNKPIETEVKEIIQEEESNEPMDQ